MIAYIIRRLFQLVIVLIGVTFITFMMLKLVPGDPAVALAGKGASPQRIAYVRHERGLDRPFYVQYYKYVTPMRTMTSWNRRLMMYAINSQPSP